MSLASEAKNRVEDTTVSPADVVTLPKKAPGTALRPDKDRSLIERLKKSGLDPQRLLDLTMPGASGKAKAKTRHQMILLGFLLCAALPSAVFSVYMFFWASDQYHSSVAFAVRSSSSTPSTEILGMVLDSGSESTTSNSYIVNDYIQSQAIVEELSKDLDLEQIFNRSQADWLFKMGTELPIEEQVSYWNKMVDVSFDSTSGVIYVEVRSFQPQDSVLIASEIVNHAEVLVNKLSETNHRETVRFAEEAVARSEARLKAIKKQMIAYREETQEVSPEDNARLAMEMIAGLDQTVAAKEAEKTTLMSYLDETSPRIRILSQEIQALKDQIATERKRVGGGSSVGSTGNLNRAALSFRIADYSELTLEEEFARNVYTTALAGLEKARHDADAKKLYLATFIKPTLSEQPQYPHRFLYSLGVFMLLTGLWSVFVLMYYNVRDRT